MTTESQKAFESWYITNAFDYEKQPIGSADCSLQRKAWRASREHIIDKLQSESMRKAVQAAISKATCVRDDECCRDDQAKATIAAVLEGI